MRGTCRFERTWRCYILLLLKDGRERDLRFGQSYTGPHRDDFCVRVNDIDIRKYGSQGQQRTAALSLKLAEIRLVEEEIHDTPVLLLDDVLSELDGSRQNYLLQSIHSIQTLITCTGLDEFVENHFEANSVPPPPGSGQRSAFQTQT